MARPTDQELELAVAGMLRWGVTVAAVVVLAGGLIYLAHPGATTPDYSHFHATESSLRSFTGILRSAFRLRPRSLIQLGLVLLIATPVARVVFCLVGFARQRDRLYVVISATVLVILLYSLSMGAH